MNGGTDDRHKRTRRRQVHVWLSNREYDWLRGFAESRDETISAALRRVVRALCAKAGAGERGQKQ